LKVVELNLLRTDLIQPREYQLKIAETASKKNTLVVLPTGAGKTLISLLVGINRLEKFPESKILITSPTRPLNAQHKKTFENFTKINPEEIVLITGKIKPEEREKLYKIGKVITATPQCIKNDLENGRLSLENFSFITFDESHRAVKDYAYTYVAKKYMEQAKNPLILALTASPGGSFERIEEIKRNLFIEAVEIRTERDEDMKKYVQPIKKDWVYVELPEDFEKIKVLLQEKLKENLTWLKEHNFIQTSRVTKKSLLMLQEKFAQRMVEDSNYSFMWAVIKVAEAIKIEHALELLETQGISPLLDFFEKIERSKRKSDRELIKDLKVREAIKIAKYLHSNGTEHPKLEKLLYIVKDLLRENPSNRIIVFANYRSTIDKINEVMRENGIKSEILIGQAVKKGKGLTQKQQIEIIKRFANGDFNVLIGSQISEEGLDLVASHVAIFYDQVSSPIRAIQRRGRVGRQIPGKVIFLITKSTRDEAFFWSSYQKEKKMKKIVYNLKEQTTKKIKYKSLLDWIKSS
jgi:Fanconi anemia group M protein